MFRVGLAVKEILENCLTAVKATFDEIYQNASIKRPGACKIFELQEWALIRGWCLVIQMDLRAIK